MATFEITQQSEVDAETLQCTIKVDFLYKGKPRSYVQQVYLPASETILAAQSYADEYETGYAEFMEEE